VARNVIN